MHQAARLQRQLGCRLPYAVGIERVPNPRPESWAGCAERNDRVLENGIEQVRLFGDGDLIGHASSR